MDLGARILAWLRIRGITQKSLADAVGVTPAAVTAWVKGHSHPSQKHLEAIVAALCLTMVEFYGAMPEPRSSRPAA